jgi:hypothetical protein
VGTGDVEHAASVRAKMLPHKKFVISLFTIHPPALSAPRWPRAPRCFSRVSPTQKVDPLVEKESVEKG